MGKGNKSLSVLLLTAVICFGSAQLQAQDVIRQGAISVQEESVTDDIDGTRIVPELQENQGMIRISVERNDYFTIQDVARWLRSGDMIFDRVNIETSNIIVRNDDTIQLRFRQDFIGDSNTVQRRVQIRHPEGHFENYFDFAQFYKQQVVNFRIDVERTPEFREEFVPRGTLEVVSNENQADVVIFNERGERIADRLILSPNPGGEGYLVEFLNIPIGSYTVRISKDGRQTITLNNVGVQNNQTTTRNVELQVDDIESGMGRIIVSTNIEEVGMEIRDLNRGVRSTFNIFAGYMSNEFPPGEYELRMTPDGFDTVTRSINLEAGQTVEEEIILIREEPIRSVEINSSPRGAEVRVDGEYIGQTPVQLTNPVREPMVMELSLERHRTVTDTLRLYTDLEYSLFEDMEQSYIHIDPAPQASVYIDGKNEGVTPYTITDPEEREYNVRLILPNYVRVDTTFNMAENDVIDFAPSMQYEMADVRITPTQPNVPATIIIEGDNYSEIFENSAVLDLSIPHGNYTVTVSRQGFNDTTQSIQINEENRSIPYDLQPKKKGVSIGLSTVIPGSGQWYWNNNSRGWMFFLGFVGAATYSAIEYSSYSDLRNEYDQLVTDYNSADSASLAIQRGEEMESTFADLIQRRDRIDMVMMVAAGIYGLNLIDRVLFTRSPNSLYERERQSGSSSTVRLDAVPNGLKLSFNF